MSSWSDTLSRAVNAVEGWEVQELLSLLVDKSLIVRDGPDRWRMLETVRDYGRNVLVDAGESENAHDRHLHYFTALAEKVEPELIGPDQSAGFDSLEREHENLRAALTWTLNSTRPTLNSPAGLRLCGALQRFWRTRGHLSEGREWCERVLNNPGTGERTKERAKTLNGAAVLAHYQGDNRSAQTYHEDGLSIMREIGDRYGIGGTLGNLGNVASARGEYSSAWKYHEECLSIMREIGDRNGIAGSLGNLGDVANRLGEYDTARKYLEESLSILRETGDRRGVSVSLNHLGRVALFQGDYASARAYQEESIAIQKQIGDQSGIADSLNGLGDVAYSQGDYASARAYQRASLAIQRDIGVVSGVAYSLEALARLSASQQLGEHAVRLWACAEKIRQKIGLPMLPKEREDYDRLVASTRLAVGEEPFTLAWAEGRAMTMDQAIELALDDG